MPTLIDLLVLSGIGGIAIFPYAFQYLRKLPAKPAPVAHDPVVANHTEWQIHWTNTLICLLNELEESGDSDAVSLTRDLMWQILGGGDKKPAAQGGKK